MTRPAGVELARSATHVRMLRLTSGVSFATCACIAEDAEAFYGYPGDVVYPKSDWQLLVVGVSVPVLEYAEQEQRAFEDFQARWNERQR